MNWEAAKDLVPADVRKLLSRALGRDKRPRPRRYIPAGMSVEAFFAAMNDAGIKCVVLRWFDTLPLVEPGEDIDMLVADEDLPALSGLLDNASGAVPCDIYSVGGLAGTQYRQRPYFPKALATRTIERRVLQAPHYQVPCPEDHFHGLAYHAVYQKGPASGLPTRHADVTPLAQPEHDYAGVLGGLRNQLGLDVAITLEALDEHLAAQGYRPAPDDLKLLGKNNSWIVSHFFR